MANRFGTRRVFAVRVLQGCGGAMMVPVGRLTPVRALPKSQLVRAMSFVAVPALIGPMLRECYPGGRR